MINKQTQKRETYNKPYKHILIHNFLETKEAQNIYETLQKQTFTESRTDLFYYWTTKDLQGSKGTLKKLYEYFKTKEFKTYIQQTTGIQLQGTIDMAGTLYKKGNYLLCHDDKVEERKLAYIYYLNTPTKGGELALYKQKKGIPTKIAKTITPTHNTLLIFRVEPTSFHEIKEVEEGNRYAISGWLT